MLEKIFVKTYAPPPVSKKEILRYAGVKEGENFDNLLKACLLETESSCRICYLALEKEKFFSLLEVKSTLLKNRLKDSEYVLLFAATVGIELDRNILRYTKLSPVKALFFQAIGAERIESLCNLFCGEIALKCEELGYATTQRFSPGYGDFPLEKQREIFDLLDCPRKIGLTLLDSGLMSPTKSVTAVIGIGKEKNEKEEKPIADTESYER